MDYTASFGHFWICPGQDLGNKTHYYLDYTFFMQKIIVILHACTNGKKDFFYNVVLDSKVYYSVIGYWIQSKTTERNNIQVWYYLISNKLRKRIRTRHNMQLKNVCN